MADIQIGNTKLYEFDPSVTKALYALVSELAAVLDKPDISKIIKRIGSLRESTDAMVPAPPKQATFGVGHTRVGVVCISLNLPDGSVQQFVDDPDSARMAFKSIGYVVPEHVIESYRALRRR